MPNYRIKKDTKKMACVIGEGNIGAFHLYQQLKDDYPDLSFIIYHDNSLDDTEVFFADANTGKSGYISMDGHERKLGDIGISKEEYGDNPLIPYGEATVPISNFDGAFRPYVIVYPEYRELAGDAIPSTAIYPMSADAGIVHEADYYDLVVEF
jgi:hypothetical protein